MKKHKKIPSNILSSTKALPEEEPIRSELFSLSQMQQYGKTLAKTHKLSSDLIPNQLLQRLSDNEEIIFSTRGLLSDSIKENQPIEITAEWFLDNFYIIEEQIRIAKQHLPSTYNRQLPQLLNTGVLGLPRVYDIALKVVSHGDGQVDAESLSVFINSYQTVSALSLGELWAIPIMLRLSIIENIRLLARRIAYDMDKKELASYWADRMIRVAEKEPKNLILEIADLSRAKVQMSGPFVAELTRILQSHPSTMGLAINWIEQTLSETGWNISRLIQQESQKQAADQLSISNCIASLRFLNAMDWKEFVESLSMVDSILRRDPSGTYPGMDFSTRDIYRHIIEDYSKYSGYSETEIAKKAIELAEKWAGENGEENKKAHVGYYLKAEGKNQLERLLNLKLPLNRRIRDYILAHPLSFYLGGIVIITLSLTLFFLYKIRGLELTLYTTGWIYWVIALLLVIGFSHFAVILINWIGTNYFKPDELAKMDFNAGIPPEHRTMVVVPTMLTNQKGVRQLLQNIEISYLSNMEKHLHFALLTDFTDADIEISEEDNKLLDYARNGIEELNNTYGKDNGNIFYLFNRPRKWNSSERKWMGYERKRGKLAALNSFLCAENEEEKAKAASAFNLIVGDTYPLSNVRYIITLDTDTQLPLNTARRLIGTIAHPLNRAEFDEKKEIVKNGYGVIQPGIAIHLPAVNRSRYSYIFSTQTGVDPYTKAISDLYQDLFHEGSYIGKGIFDVQAFQKTFSNRFPENKILSHDLLEGCHLRAGLVSDILLYEDFPSTYAEDTRRQHRWIRGDWQIASWIFPRVRGIDRKLYKNPLSALSRWKIFDNLRRSLESSAFFFLLVISWIFLPYAVIWTLTVVLIKFFLPILSSIIDIINKPKETALLQHIRSSFKATAKEFYRACYSFICLPYEAWISLDAIFRTVIRLLITKKHLLEWNPSHIKTEIKSSNGNANPLKEIISIYRKMWFAPVASLITLFSIIYINPAVLGASALIIILWGLSPLAALWISKPKGRMRADTDEKQKDFLRLTARRTWSFFTTFINAKENWLPPDNYQEQPTAVVAHRTSPTNIGLSLLANLTAYDFGYISSRQLLERTRNTMQTLQKLERLHGHFYNWYDTVTLRPLLPIYISTVDSGNLAGHLLNLKAGLTKLLSDEIVNKSSANGIKDTYHILESYFKNKPEELVKLKRTIDEFIIIFNLIYDETKEKDVYISDIYYALDKMASVSAELALYMENNMNIGGTGKPDNELYWANELAKQCEELFNEFIYLHPEGNVNIYPENEKLKIESLPTLNDIISESSDEYKERAKERIELIENLISLIDDFTDLEYEFLYDRTRKLFSIGYNVTEHRLDGSYYDLLASEVRLSTYIAIAQHKIPQESWFTSGRQLTTTGGQPTLLSWSGSMFEYLMPLLVMPTFENTLLDISNRAAVQRQIDYGRQKGIPWGISESGFNSVDVAMNYQYKAFGVPGLGFKRGLTDDLVIAPYATALALMVLPEEACRNMMTMRDEGFIGKYGFYEAIDYTSSRLRRGEKKAIVKSYMAHHQGMLFVSINNHLNDNIMHRRFSSIPILRSAMLLLQERIPDSNIYYSNAPDFNEIYNTGFVKEMPVRIFKTANTGIPEVQLLSNGSYHVMITNSGSGYSKWNDISINRWREDSVSDKGGNFFFLMDANTKEVWSTTYLPTGKMPKNYEVIFSQGRAEFRKAESNFDTYTIIVVSPEDNIELRRIKITNKTRNKKTLVLTSYSEIVLNNALTDETHPVFSNLFVETEILEEQKAIIATRRKRSADDKTAYCFQHIAIQGNYKAEVSYETDRMKFTGRNNLLQDAEMLHSTSSLSNTSGYVLDPISSIRYILEIEAETTITIDNIYGICNERKECINLIDKYQDHRMSDRVIDMSWSHSNIVLKQINATENDAQLYNTLVGSMLFNNTGLRTESNNILRNSKNQTALWSYGVSGDLPIILLIIEESANLQLARQLIQAHTYWRLKGFWCDLVIWNDDHSGYRQNLHDEIMGIISGSAENAWLDKKGGIYLRPADQIPIEDKILFQTIARIIIYDKKGTLTSQLKNAPAFNISIPLLKTVKSQKNQLSAPKEDENKKVIKENLLFYNGNGGFTEDGKEYIINISKSNRTPLPWVNIIANKNFGSLISESGVIYSWADNSHEFRLTPWHNDPVTSSGGEAFYLRDEESGYYWSPTYNPTPGQTGYRVRHGLGYTVFEHIEDGIYTELWIYAGIDSNVKFSLFKIKNLSGRYRRISITSYLEWVLGELRSKTSMFITTEIDNKTGAVFAKNVYSYDYQGWTAFHHSTEMSRTFTTDRNEFLGRNNSLKKPIAMLRSHLSGKTSSGADCCSAIQIKFELQNTHELEYVFIMGAASDSQTASSLVSKYSDLSVAKEELNKVWSYWNRTLSTIRLETPDKSLNFISNYWLQYQTLTSRYLARTGFYQSSGAIGFRDQLQDVLALINIKPMLVREHILLCASRQFTDGDVQHWWHPKTGKGVRTKCSDDYLWLPYIASHYALKTGDTGIFDQIVNYIEGRRLNPDEDTIYEQPVASAHSGSLYEHCIRAIDYGLKLGEHGLPLMGDGDWNDGMNMVGIKGKGESVWLGFFLYNILITFSEIAVMRQDEAYAQKCRENARMLKNNLQTTAWDGDWYKRAWFDDGTPLGSKENDECKIDSITQSWAVLSLYNHPETEAYEKERTEKAMASVYENLVDKKNKIIKLLSPPFDKTDMNPGYIKGYLPGIRENGGQYTHAAIWTAMAYSVLKDKEKTFELLNFLNPVKHSDTAEKNKKYKAEPYVIAADIYSLPMHEGRGGWTWYTGSAGWMYRFIIENFIGLRLKYIREEINAALIPVLEISPTIPKDWQEIKIDYFFKNTLYHLIIRQQKGEKQKIIVDSNVLDDNRIYLKDDNREHNVVIS